MYVIAWVIISSCAIGILVGAVRMLFVIFQFVYNPETNVNNHVENAIVCVEEDEDAIHECVMVNIESCIPPTDISPANHPITSLSLNNCPKCNDPYIPIAYKV